MKNRKSLFDTARSIINLYWLHSYNNFKRAVAEGFREEQAVSNGKMDALVTVRQIIDLIEKGDEAGLRRWCEGLNDDFEKTWADKEKTNAVRSWATTLTDGNRVDEDERY